MLNRLAAVISSLNDDGIAVAQITLRADGTLDSYGDPSVAAETLAVLLSVGPAKLAELKKPLQGAKCPVCGCTNPPDHLKCDDCGLNLVRPQ
ncbi:MAG TPA: hypothetical protein VGM54_10015 [Chthoniobacter sp.]|jgi:hypothetical protein